MTVLYIGKEKPENNRVQVDRGDFVFRSYKEGWQVINEQQWSLILLDSSIAELMPRDFWVHTNARLDTVLILR